MVHIGELRPGRTIWVPISSADLALSKRASRTLSPQSIGLHWLFNPSAIAGPEQPCVGPLAHHVISLYDFSLVSHDNCHALLKHEPDLLELLKIRKSFPEYPWKQSYLCGVTCVSVEDIMLRTFLERLTYLRYSATGTYRRREDDGRQFAA